MKNWVPIQIPLAAGLDTKGDPRSASPPQFDLLRDVEFEQIGGLQTRKVFAAMSKAIFGGGSLSSVRRVFANGDELLCFTKDSLYSWNAQLSKWVLKGTHLAVKVEEKSKFITTGDQIDADRAELNGTVVYAWTDSSTGYVAAVDKTTGSVLMAPTSIGPASRLRVVALTTKILLSFCDNVGTGQFYCWMLDPAAPATAIAGSSTTVYNSAGTGNSYYDVVKVPGADTALFACRLNPTTSYVIVKVTSALVVTSSVKARTCTGPIALSCEPTGASVQIVRGNGADIQGDYITISSLADVTVNQVLGTALALPISHITAAHRSVTDSGQYRCYYFWADNEQTNTVDWTSFSGYVDTGGTISVGAAFVRRLGIASRAFDYDGHIYVWGAFAGVSASAGVVTFPVGQLQNTYFLYRDTGTFHAKSSAGVAGGFSTTIGHLPAVSLTAGSTEYSWAGTSRRVVPLGSGSGYADRGPRDIAFTFDSNEARRTARLGLTLYVTGGEILQYDGQQLVECGFHIYPWYLLSGETSAGNLLAGTYAFKMTWRWDNAVGELDRSTTATVGTQLISAVSFALPNGYTLVGCMPLYQTHKTINPPAVEVWRTGANPTPDAPFFLVTSKDPAITSNPNRYLVNDPSSSTLATFNDELADSVATTHETNPENGSVLENLAPPAATIILATNDRLFLAGVAGDRDRVWYSKRRGDGEVAAFHDALTITIPPAGGDITALSFLNETLVVFRESAVYVLPGQGYDNLGGGQNFGPATKVPGNVGAVSHESVAVVPMGVFFQSSKGYYLLSPRWTCDYIGAQINQFDAEDAVAVHVVESQHQVRVLTASRMLMLDYRINEWSEWTVANAADATIWQSTYVYLDSSTSEVKAQTTGFAGIDFGMDAELAWIKLNDLQGAGSVRRLMILGEFRGVHKVRVRLARDYQQDGSGNWVYYQDETITPTPATIGSALQLRIDPSIPKCEAIKVRITAVGLDGVSAPTTEAFKLTGLGLEVGVDRGLYRQLPAAQKG